MSDLSRWHFFMIYFLLFSCPAFSCPAIWSVICLAFSVNPYHRRRYDNLNTWPAQAPVDLDIKDFYLSSSSSSLATPTAAAAAIITCCNVNICLERFQRFQLSFACTRTTNGERHEFAWSWLMCPCGDQCDRRVQSLMSQLWRTEYSSGPAQRGRWSQPACQQPIAGAPLKLRTHFIGLLRTNLRTNRLFVGRL